MKRTPSPTREDMLAAREARERMLDDYYTTPFLVRVIPGARHAGTFIDPTRGLTRRKSTYLDDDSFNLSSPED